MIITTKRLFLASIIVLIACILTSFFAIQALIKVHQKESLKEYQLNLYSAVEAGPLAFTRLHSASITEELLVGLVKTLNSNGEVVHSVIIRSLGDSPYTFASFQNTSVLSKKCRVDTERIFSFPDSIAKFSVEAVFDRCAHSQRLDLVILSIQKVIVGLSLILFIAFIFLSFPLFISLQKATKFLGSSNDDELQIEVPYKPIQTLLEMARQGKLLEAKKTKLDIARQVAHDIRSPLTALEIVSQKMPQADEVTDLVVTAAQRIKKIADDLLNHDSYNNDDSYTPQAYTVDQLQNLVSDIVKEKELTLNGLDVDIVFDKELRNLGVIYNEVWLGRIVSNILNNAYEAQKQERLKVGIDFELQDQFFVIHISDNGEGFQKPALEQFGKEGFTTKVRGKGIGLSSALRTVKEWGGSIEIDSEINIGSTVHLKLKHVRLEDDF